MAGQREAQGQPRTDLWYGRSEIVASADRAVGIAPADATDEPLFANQWHFSSSLGYDINIESVWQDYSGAGISIVVVDQGIQLDHPDLVANIDPVNQIDSPNNQIGAGEGAPQTTNDRHGTAVAGVIAAADNSIDGVGVAYDATLVSAYTPLSGAADEFAGLAYSQGFDIANNSWGWNVTLFDAFPDNFLDTNAAPGADASFAQYGAKIEEIAEDGRDGLGTILVFAAGNGRQYGDDVNLFSFQNSRYTLAVGATDENGEIADFSNPGAALLLSAPGVDILTTDRTGANGYESGNTTTIDGTSFSAPIVSGVTALMLEANPGLGVRDIQEIYAASSRTIDPAESHWQTNGADWWNGGGLTWSHDYGSGLIDAHAAVRLAETWFIDQVFGSGTGSARTFNNEISTSQTYSSNFAIPENSASGVSRTVTITDDFEIDQIELHLQLDHTAIIDLIIELTSPAGTTAILFNEPQSFQEDIDFVFSSTFFWGEMSAGIWTLNVADVAPNDTGTVTNWELSIFGDADSADDTFIYTNEYGADFKTANAARRTLSDSAGEDTINVAAMDLTGKDDSTIDLTPGSVSTIAGRSLTIASGTLIENVIAGDGDDTITGNSTDNRLFGGRGNDTISGGAGNDLLLGGRGNDTLDGGTGNDTASYAAAIAAVTVDLGLASSQVIGGGLGSDKLLNIDGLIGSAFGDTLTGDGGANHLFGGDGDDILTGTEGDDTLSGGAGSDTASSGRGNDTLIAGPGGDRLRGQAGNDTLVGGAGNDRLEGGDGLDTLDYSGAGGGISVDLGTTGRQAAGAGQGNDMIRDIERVLGSAFDDRLEGSGQADTLAGSDGDDVLLGRSGSDMLTGGNQSDILRGHGGDDTLDGGADDDNLKAGGEDDLLLGGAGADRLIGQGGDDTLIGGAGNDRMEGGAGIDRADYSAASGSVFIDLGLNGYQAIGADQGSDLLRDIEVLSGSSFGDTLEGSGDSDTLLGGGGDDKLLGRSGDDSILGGDGDDILRGYAGNDTLDGGAGNDVLKGYEADDHLIGGAGDDSLIGDEGIDTLEGGDGDDVLDGGLHNGSLSGGAGNDSLTGSGMLDGGDGDDTVVGGTDHDSLSGGAGDDILSSADGRNTFDGGAGNDTITGGDDDDTMFGGDGNDTLAGDAADDFISGGSGDDSLDGGGGLNTLSGDAGNDLLTGGGSNDSLLGGAGNDTILAGAGRDTIDGGAGNDTIQAGDNNDRILFDSTASGFDSIDGGTGTDFLIATAADINNVITFASDGNGTLNMDANGSSGFSLIDIELLTLTTGSGNDQIDASGSTFDGLVVDAGTGDDTITGGTGNETFKVNVVQGGRDAIFGGAGSEELHLTSTVNTGNHTLSLSQDASGEVQIQNISQTFLFTGEANDVIDLGASLSFLVVDAGGGNDLINATASTSSATIVGGTGHDIIQGGSRGERLNGQGGQDTVDGNDGNDFVLGGGANDTVRGGAGNDMLQGDSGDDTLVGGAGNDTISGNTGNDLFVFVDGDEDDFVFADSDGTDVFDLSGVTEITDFSDLTSNHVTTYTNDDLFNNNGVLITYGNDSISLVNWEVSNLSSDSFIF